VKPKKTSGIAASFMQGLLLAGGIFTATAAQAQTATSAGPTTLTEQGKLIRAPQAVGVLGPDLFGDKINFYNGSLEFVQTDVSLPGNNSLPVSVGRRLVTGNKNQANHLFMEWDLEIPHLSGMFAAQDGWRGKNGGARCSSFGAPPDVTIGITTFKGLEFWHGSSLYVPGLGSQEILTRNPLNTNIPADGVATPLVTKGNWAIRCLTALASTGTGTPLKDTGQGFLAIAPDGTQYRFDWLVSRSVLTIGKPAAGQPSGFVTPNAPPPTDLQAPAGGVISTVALIENSIQVGGINIDTGTDETPNAGGGIAYVGLPRAEVWIMPTLVSDRFGNTVSYAYDPADKRKLLSITASDGRKLTLTYVAGTALIGTVSDCTRTWTYTYGSSDSGRTILKTVTLPDTSKWNFAGMDGAAGQFGRGGLVEMQIKYSTNPDVMQPSDCAYRAEGLDGPDAIGTMIHPSSAIGTFSMKPTNLGRNGVPLGCRDGAANYPAFIDGYSLTEKSISGPGLPNMTWRTNYDGANNPGWAGCETCKLPNIVLVTEPRGDVTRYTFGSTYAVDEGMLKQVDTGWNGSTALRTMTTRFNKSFTQAVGTSDQDRGDNWITSHLLPEDLRTITQQGSTFTWAVAANADFDAFARPKKVTRSSTLGFSRTEATVYEDNLKKWILGQTKSVTEPASGAVMVANSYDTTNANLLTTSRFGLLDKTYTYNADGTLATSKDGKSQSTAYSNYKRGLAQKITYPNASIETAVVSDIGLVTTYTNQAGFASTYGYDAMGRLASVTQPAADTVAWSATTLVFEPVAASEYGIPAGHWRQTVSTGNARAITYLDAFWRPVLTRTYDTGNEANTAKMVLTKYDAGGNVYFESYPQRTISSVTAVPDGTSTAYDALARPTSTTAASELGSLTTGYAYLTGFQKKTTNPRGIPTTVSYQAFDAPSEDAITKMTGAYGLTVNISRDIFGKPSAITRSGDNISATRSYVYDSNARLCKTIEPETGATVQDYDAANNTIWRASGLALPSTACDRTSVAAAKKISYTYDTLNRLTGTSYGDASPAITRTYTPDGLPLTNTSNGAVWTYTYNKRRLPTKESLAYAGKTYNISWGYDANGSLAQLNYPDAANTAITYSPNALGEATAVSNYASSISYHPNGAIAGFTYANNIAHTMAQNTRGLPKQVTDAGVLDDIYTYDANGNVTGIQDMQENVTTRTMGYDDLDRLATANAANLWGNATFQNDALDNIVSSKITSGGTARTSSHYIDYATNRLTSITSTAGQYAFAYSYDSQGNITKRGTQTYVFDQGNRLASATGKASYSYDGLGRRVKIAKADGTTQIQVYSQSGQLLYGTTAVGAATPTESKYVYLGGTLLADIGVAYVHTDGLGSPVARTNSAKTILSRTRYEPYGLTAAGAQPTIGFTGHVNDADTGLINMQQRYYDPVAGRFLSVDPVLTDANTGDSFNRYSYAENNPYRYVDPDGRSIVGLLMKTMMRAVVKDAVKETAKAGAKQAAKSVAKEGAKDGAKAAEKAAVEGAKRGPKTDPLAPHNAKIREVGDKMEAEGGTVSAGGGRLPEKVVDTPGGMKDTRRPDIIYKDAQGVERGVNVGKARANGEPVSREVNALKDINGPGKLPTTFEPYN
jgi:RHS repeat-associated protein